MKRVPTSICVALPAQHRLSPNLLLDEFALVRQSVVMVNVAWNASGGMAQATMNGEPVWEGTVDGGRVAKVLPVVDSDDAIVLLDGDQRPEGIEPWHPFRNIVRIAPTGDVQWRGDLPPSGSAAKCYYDMSWSAGRIRALAWSYECWLDPLNGRLLESTFTK
jgi:hypothetical protein